MPRVIAAFFFGIWLGCLTTAVAQLPPDVLVDQYLLRADRLMEAKDATGALEMMAKIVALQEEHSLTLPDEFHFKHAKMAFSAGSIDAAKDSVNRYLTVAGREGKFYGEALELSLEIAELGAERTPCAGRPKGSVCWMELANRPKTYVWNADYQPYRTVTWTGDYLGNLAHGRGSLKWIVDIDSKPPETSPSRALEPKCARNSNGTGCWMEVTKQPGCYVWNPNPQPDETVTWSGECAGGLAQGEGTRKWIWEDGEKTSEEKGLLRDGKSHGQWTWRNAEGEEGKSFYVYGEHVGNTADDVIVMEGLLVKGKKHGKWAIRYADGEVGEGSYVEGKRHGDWIQRDKDGNVTGKGPYSEGKREGQWAIRYANGNVHEGPFVNGKPEGQWVWRWANGTVGEGPMVDGKRHGDWVERFPSGDRVNGAYSAGWQHGHWVWRDKDGKVVQQGPYLHGKKHGDWVEYDYGNSVKGAYVEGKRHGRWIKILTNPDYREEVKGKIDWMRNYENGELHGSMSIT